MSEVVDLSKWRRETGVRIRQFQIADASPRAGAYARRERFAARVSLLIGLAASIFILLMLAGAALQALLAR